MGRISTLEVSVAVLTTACPHPGCRADPVQLEVLRNYLPISGPTRVVSCCMCPRCEMPVSLVLSPEAGGVGPNWFVLEAGYGKHDLVKASKWAIKACFPTPTSKRVPEHVPIDIARIYQQAVSCLLRREKEAAALLLRRSTEKALNRLNCIHTGSLSDRVNLLAREGRIAGYFGEWASELSLLFTRSEIDEPKLDDVIATSEFVEAFVLSAFTINRMFELRRSRVDSSGAVD